MRTALGTTAMLSMFFATMTAQLNGTVTVGSTGDYADLSAAFAAINSNGVSGVLTVSILESISEPGTTSLTRSDLSSSNAVLIKPAAATAPVVTVSSLNGISVNSASYVTIDGSNSGGTTRDLSIVRSAAASGSSCLTLQGTCTNMTVRNCIVGGVTNVPDYALRIDGTSIGTVTIQNNEIHGMGDANGIIYFNNVGGISSVADNVLAGDAAGSSRAYGVNLANCTGTITIAGNTLYALQTSGADLIGIREDLSSSATLKIINNFLGGNFTGASVSNVYAIMSLSGSSLTRQVYHNTVLLNSIGGSPFTAACIFFDGGGADVRNNILFNAFNNSSAACLYEETGFDPNDLTSNYNDLYKSTVNGRFGIIIPGVDATTLGNWQANSTGEDANSVSTAVQLVSTTNDFHLTGGSDGDTQLKGTPLAGVTTDIDGNLRSATFPYMGAHEASTVLPVQMAALRVSVNGMVADLAWSTRSEVQNVGFDIERRSLTQSGASWTKTGFVSGFGTSATTREYQFRQTLPSAGRYAFRLKQIDRDGSFRFSENVEIEITIPRSMMLESYPNPFNPVAIVRFSVADQGHARVAVFNVLGERVAILFDEEVYPASHYEVPFDASSLPSGVYVLRMETGGQSRALKVLLAR